MARWLRGRRRAAGRADLTVLRARVCRRARRSKDKKSTLRPVKKHATAKRSTLSAYTRRTLGSGNLRAAVMLPENENINEWLAVSLGARLRALSPFRRPTALTATLPIASHCFAPGQANTVDFFNEISLLYGLIADDASKVRVVFALRRVTVLCPCRSSPNLSLPQFTKPGEGFPPGFEYRWADGVNIVKPMRCSSPEYVDYVMMWVEDQINNEDIFPVQESQPFPPDFGN